MFLFLDSAIKLLGDWDLRISVLVSLAAYVFRGLLSGTRRRSASGCLSSFTLWFLRILLWWLYELGEIYASAAVTNLSLCSDHADDALEKEKQRLAAFWGPFLLIHLGGPDNLSAYDLEDNMLSLRKWIEMSLEILGVLYAFWNYIYRARPHSRLMLAASFIVLVEGITRYVERAWTLLQANLEKMQEQHEHSRKKPPVDPAAAASGSSSWTTTSASSSSSSSRSMSRATAVKSTISTYEGARTLDDGDALLLAQDLHEVWHRFLVGRGGELTTVLWIVIQHAGPFRIGEEGPGYYEDADSEEKQGDEKQPTEESKEKEKEEEPQMLYPRPCPYPYPRPCPYPCPYHYPCPCPCPYPPQPPPVHFIEEDTPKMPEPGTEPEPETLLLLEDEELDPDDAKDAKVPIRYVTLY